MLNEVQKQDILEGISEVLTKVAGSACDHNFMESVWIVIEEQEPGNWYLGGKTPTSEMQVYRNRHGEDL